MKSMGEAMLSPKYSAVILLLTALAACEAPEETDTKRYRVPMDLAEWSPDFSPDGQFLAYSSINPDDAKWYLAELELATGEASFLFMNDSNTARPRYSADGRKILFLTATFSETFDIALYDRETGNVRRVEIPETDSFREDTPVWSADKSAIYFNSVRNGTDADIFRFDLATQALEEVVTGPGNQRYPYASPDGTKLVYRDDIDGDQEIFVLDLETGESQRLTENEHVDQAAVYSPDGQYLSWFSQAFGDAEIVIAKSDGSELKRLTQSYDWDFMPDFSPDGSKIAFDSRRTGRRSLYMMNADGTNIEHIGPNQASTLILDILEDGVERALTEYEQALGDMAYAEPPFLDSEGGVIAGRLLSETDEAGALRLADVWLKAYPWFNARNNYTHIALGELMPLLAARAEASGSINDLTVFGLGQFRLGQFDGAEETFNRLLELDPENSVAHEGLKKVAAARANAD